MKIVNLETEKDSRRYGVETLMRDVKSIHEKEQIETMIIIYKREDGVTGIGTTYGNNAETLGLIELGKKQYLDHLGED